MANDLLSVGHYSNGSLCFDCIPTEWVQSQGHSLDFVLNR